MDKYHRDSVIEFDFLYDRNLYQVERTVYNSFMMLGDIGGLFGLLFSISTTLLGIINFQKSENILVSDLYKTR